MEFISSSHDVSQEYAIALGNFDGLHHGHKYVIETAKLKAQQLHCKSAVVTFWPHPRHVLSSHPTQEIQEIFSLQTKISKIKEMGIDEVFIIHFSKSFSRSSAEDFIRDICAQIKIRSITTGYNFRFGYKKQGDIHTLDKLCKKYSFRFNTVSQILYNGCLISSSILREVLKIGCVKLFYDFTNIRYFVDCNIVSAIEDLIEAQMLDSCLLPQGAYFSLIEEVFCCVFLSGSRVIIKPLEANRIFTSPIRVEFVQLLEQYETFDISLIDSYMKSAMFCLEAVKCK